MEILGYFLFVLVGITLGLVGSGGSILALPILVYVLKLDPATATVYSLFIVGTTAFAGAMNHTIRNNVDYKTVCLFGGPSIAAAYLTRLKLLPLIPQKIGQLGSLEITKSLMLMLIFSLVMIAASFSMIRKKHYVGIKADKKSGNDYLMIFLIGLSVGFLTGLIGVGGGFLIIPALVMFGGTPIKKAIGTSLMIIALNSLIGFLGDLHLGYSINNIHFITYSLTAIAGMFIGMFLSRRVSGDKLQTGFGWFVLLMGAYIFVAELFLPKN